MLRTRHRGKEKGKNICQKCVQEIENWKQLRVHRLLLIGAPYLLFVLQFHAKITVE